MNELNSKQLATIQRRKRKAWNKAILKAEKEAEAKLDVLRRNLVKKPVKVN